MQTERPHDLVYIKSPSDLDEMRAQVHKLIELSPEEFAKLKRKTADGRSRWLHKNRYRNKPCFCGSGKKFKKCCW